MIPDLMDAAIVICTTTPWTMPANRAICYSPKIAYGLYRVTAAPDGNWAKVGATYLLADALADAVFKAAKVDGFERVRTIEPAELKELTAAHPLARQIDGYGFDVPLLDGDHVTDDTGTGFVHTAPSHGRDDFDVWTANSGSLRVTISTRASPTPSMPTVASPPTRRASPAAACSTTRAPRATPTRR